MSPSLKIFPVPILKDNYVWFIENAEKQAAVIVDPGEAAPVIDYLKKHHLSLAGILITHHHWDHTDGLSEIKQLYSAPVYGPRQVAGITQLAENHAVIKEFPVSFTVLPVAGHTLQHVAYYAPGMLFCGDTLFAAGCGRIFEGTPQQMYNALQTLAALPIDTKVYCAHEYTLNNLRFAETVEPSNSSIQDKIKIVTNLREHDEPSLPSLIEEERDTNPFLRCEVKEVIKSAEKFSGKKLMSPIEVFAALRKWKDSW